MVKIATPISHLFHDEVVGGEILSFSDALEFRDHSVNFSPERQVAFHCELQPIHPMSEDDFEYLQKVKELKSELKLVTFHVACCCDAPVLLNGVFEIGGTSFSRGGMLKNAVRNFERIKKIFGPEIDIAIENNNYYPTEAYAYVTDPLFLSQLVKENDLRFLFDIAHAHVTAHNMGMAYTEYLGKLPLEKTIQLHICKSGINQVGQAFDAHNAPNLEDYEEIKGLLREYDIQYLTVEYYRDKETLIETLKKLKSILSELS